MGAGCPPSLASLVRPCRSIPLKLEKVTRKKRTKIVVLKCNDAKTPKVFFKYSLTYTKSYLNLFLYRSIINTPFRIQSIYLQLTRYNGTGKNKLTDIIIMVLLQNNIQASVVTRLIVWLVNWLIGSLLRLFWLVRLVHWLGWFIGEAPQLGHSSLQ